MQNKVPYYSQFSDVADEAWKSRACSIVCLFMALEHAHPRAISSIDHLIQEGVVIGGYTEHGWDHKSLALLSHNHGVPAYAEEFRSMNVDLVSKSSSPSKFASTLEEYGIQKLAKHLRKGRTAIASIRPGLSSGKSIHTVLLIGFKEKDGELIGFFFHDPDSPEAPRNDQFIALPDFRSYWRKMAIFIG